MLKRLFLKLLVIFLVIFIVLALLAVHQSSSFRRDPEVLMNKYYRYKFENPAVAKKALEVILTQDPNDLPALIELSEMLLEMGQYHEAVVFLRRIHANAPGMSIYTYQLAYAYYKIGDWESSKKLFEEAVLYEPLSHWRTKAQAGIEAMASFLPFYQDEAHVEWVHVPSSVTTEREVSQTSLPHRDVQTQPSQQALPISGLDRFYSLRHVDKKRAFSYIQQHVKRHPTDIKALKEAGYLALSLHQRALAIEYLTRAYAMTHDPKLAMQIAYLYNDIGENKLAYRYFEWATYAKTDEPFVLEAQNAMTTLRGQQTKLFSPPYFGEFFAMPFTQTRFGLTVTQFIERLGVEQQNAWRTREYVFSQTTDDNQSKAASLGQISQIFEDDVQIIGIGAQMSPLKNIPLILYGEMGAAYDLVYRDRPRWRSDFRGGYMYYQEVGKNPAYYDKPRWSLDYYSLYYNDLTYFSRYQNNVIGVAKSHQGIRLLQYKSSIVNVYARGIMVYDVQRLFYNNYAEIGPSIGFIPSNRYNFEVRYDLIRGVYLPAGAVQNPYGKYYNNQLLQLLLYVKL